MTWQPCHVTCSSVGVVGCLRCYVGGGGDVHSRLSKSKRKVNVANEKENKNVPRARDRRVLSSAIAFSSHLLSRRGPVHHHWSWRCGHCWCCCCCRGRGQALKVMMFWRVGTKLSWTWTSNNVQMVKSCDRGNAPCAIANIYKHLRFYFTIVVSTYYVSNYYY